MLEKAPASQAGSTARSVGSTVDTGTDIIKGVGKGVANTGIGVNNLMAAFKVGDTQYVDPY
jgi:hypothetical protein